MFVTLDGVAHVEVCADQYILLGSRRAAAIIHDLGFFEVNVAKTKIGTSDRPEFRILPYLPGVAVSFPSALAPRISGSLGASKT